MLSIVLIISCVFLCFLNLCIVLFLFNFISNYFELQNKQQNYKQDQILFGKMRLPYVLYTNRKNERFSG